MSIGLICFQSIVLKMAAAQLYLKAWTGFSKIMKTDQCHYPSFCAGQWYWTWHCIQQARCYCSNIKEMLQ